MYNKNAWDHLAKCLRFAGVSRSHVEIYFYILCRYKKVFFFLPSDPTVRVAAK